ncbi:JmjC domain-containing protein [Magnaporthiopsis poae ATCC 64411]|uniref:JmjC domain-containing protein n=1 Tax=Magnaporthiopsis poae (strain ATCC 64411 / 73-15) TaxID=644358 RepID=A0A0C4EDP5_MAGP6|nr:JmjC domain-containing protein [Magnaporthiopsis poae ATCC 64411]
MPSSTHPQAKFDPIPPNLDLDALVENTPNFEWVLRVPAAKIHRLGPQGFEKLVLLHVILGGRPLVIEKWNDRLPRSVFSAQWLEATYDKKEEAVRDIGSQSDMRMTIGHYLRSMKQLTNQWTPSNFRDERRQRLYLKDIDCPPEWHDRLQKILPANVFYMNDNIDQRSRQPDPDSFEDRSIAPSGDLMSSLPEEMRAQNLMCYIGHEGTYTPAHREMCASLGQNIMVEASTDENGEKPGSSVWFMTETKDREVVKEFFLSMLGHDIEIEKHFAQINAWKKATFPVYVVEQRVGDFILVPPLAPHQVWNRGTRTMKVAWNRTTVETLEMALHEALPKARLVCRDEQYKNKAIIYYSLKKYYKDLRSMEENHDMGWLDIGQDIMRNSARSKQMMQDFKKLFALFTEILVGEMFGHKETDVEFIEFDSNITCSYCRANIFNRFLTCKHCVRMLVNGDEDTYDVCMECYTMGRSCVCASNLTWCEQWDWAELVDNYETWRTMIITDDGYVDINSSPLPLEIARRKTNKKSVAQICQEQLRRRPFKDITKVDEPEVAEPSDVEVDEEGRPVKKKKGRKKKKGEIYRCHVCCHKDNTFRLAFCSNQGCTEAYCYGTLYRAFDMMPQDVMATEKWKCPRCTGICNCGTCRRLGTTTPYTPKNTLLGHDTKRIADDRSIELLVDFRIHNLNWLKATGEEGRSQDSRRMQKLKEQAEADKASSSRASADPLAPAEDAVQQPATNGYGDQSNILGGAPAEGPAGEQTNGADDTTLADLADQSAFADTSAYPEQAGGHDRMLGLAYYQQDDSPDKILFDEYEMFSAEDLQQEEQSEFLKKSLRAAKRRARQLDDNDPDFQGPRSHKRKKPRMDKDVAALYHAMVDPTLTDDVTMGGANEAGEGIAAGPSDTVPGEPGKGENDIDRQYLPYEPNQPTLRHARPSVSYLEPEINPEDEFNEITVPRRRQGPEGVDSMDPMDLAAGALRTLTGEGSAQPPRRRPGRPRGPRFSEHPAPAVEKEPEPRPRQSRTSLLASKGLDRIPRPDEDQDADADDVQESSELLAAELDASESRSPARPETSTPAQPRRRGRPPKQRPVTDTPDSASRDDQQTPLRSAEPKFLSMKERMALKGKKFRIKASKASGSVATTSGSASVAEKPGPGATAGQVEQQQDQQPQDHPQEPKDQPERQSEQRPEEPSVEQPQELSVEQPEERPEAPEQAEKQVEIAKPRPRGRPPRASQTNLTEQPTAQPTERRPRGRPPRASQTHLTEQSEVQRPEGKPQQRRPRGRPRKDASRGDDDSDFLSRSGEQTSSREQTSSHEPSRETSATNSVEPQHSLGPSVVEPVAAPSRPLQAAAPPLPPPPAAKGPTVVRLGDTDPESDGGMFVDDHGFDDPESDNDSDDDDIPAYKPVFTAHGGRAGVPTRDGPRGGPPRGARGIRGGLGAH